MNISKGLILKDLLQLKSYLKTLIIYTAIFILIGMANQSPDGINIMLIFMITFGFGMFTMASFDYDEKAKADNYLLTFPLTKKTVVFFKIYFDYICNNNRNDSWNFIYNSNMYIFKY